ncbi:MAG TPA: UvrD-helicase domain-containing protein, partial [Acidocella sp.]|nr:UvrD-helicase domain-containing protein [Acidocella sp.]
MTAIDLANEEQRKASNPLVSTFTAASAGSGKTKLLTDRLLRLMLGGARPEKILCLTYTKAAAAEMRIRLNARLGKWVVLPREALEAELRALDVVPDAKTLGLARKIFADVLDLPGGMRIETIHAFCQSLLRRFPLEAELSPHFEVADDEKAALRLREAREAALADAEARGAIEALAGEIDEQSFARLTQEFCASPEAALLSGSAPAVAALQRAALGANEGECADIIAQAVMVPGEAELREMFLRIAYQGTASGQARAQFWLDWLAQPPEERGKNWEEWAVSFFTTAGEPRKMGPICGKALRAVEEEIDAVIGRERDRIRIVQERVKTARLAALNEAAVTLLLPILAAERGAKQMAAQLSYGDLISYT